MTVSLESFVTETLRASSQRYIAKGIKGMHSPENDYTASARWSTNDENKQ
jgi:hypothetical protein